LSKGSALFIPKKYSWGYHFSMAKWHVLLAFNLKKADYLIGNVFKNPLKTPKMHFSKKRPSFESLFIGAGGMSRPHNPATRPSRKKFGAACRVNNPE